MLSDNTAEIIDYTGSAVDLTIPASLDGYTVTAIGNYALDNCTTLKTVAFGNQVRSIEYRAFYNCTALDDVYFRGDEEAWDAITINDYNQALTDATIHYNVTAGLTGDLNGDSKVNITDSLLLFAAASGRRQLTAEQIGVADMNGDGKVNVVDSMLLFKKISGR